MTSVLTGGGGSDSAPASVTEATGTLPVAPQAGDVTWHCSEEDGGPDVGLSLSLGGEQALYIGELADATLAENGIDPSLGMGWWVVLEDGHSLRPVAAVADQEAARALFDALTVAVRP